MSILRFAPPPLKGNAQVTPMLSGDIVKRRERVENLNGCFHYQTTRNAVVAISPFSFRHVVGNSLSRARRGTDAFGRADQIRFLSSPPTIRARGSAASVSLTDGVNERVLRQK